MAGKIVSTIVPSMMTREMASEMNNSPIHLVFGDAMGAAFLCSPNQTHTVVAQSMHGVTLHSFSVTSPCVSPWPTDAILCCWACQIHQITFSGVFATTYGPSFSPLLSIVFDACANNCLSALCHSGSEIESVSQVRFLSTTE